MEKFREYLTEALNLLSLKSDDQLKYLHEIGIYGIVDELALEFDDIAIMAEQKYAEGEISEEQYKIIKKLSEKLDFMSGKDKSHLWTEYALKNANEWEEIRELAKGCTLGDASKCVNDLSCDDQRSPGREKG